MLKIISIIVGSLFFNFTSAVVVQTNQNPKDLSSTGFIMRISFLLPVSNVNLLNSIRERITSRKQRLRKCEDERCYLLWKNGLFTTNATLGNIMSADEWQRWWLVVNKSLLQSFIFILDFCHVVSWVNGIRIGKLSPYILDSSGANQNLTLVGCQSAKLQIIMHIEVN